MSLYASIKNSVFLTLFFMFYVCINSHVIKSEQYFLSIPLCYYFRLTPRRNKPLSGQFAIAIHSTLIKIYSAAKRPTLWSYLVGLCATI